MFPCSYVFACVCRFLATLALAELLTDAEADTLATSSDMITLLLACVAEALQSDNHRASIAGTSANVIELVRGKKETDTI